MQKLLFITRTLNGRGGQVILTNLIRTLRQQGYSVHFVAFKPEGTPDFPDCEPLYAGLQTQIVSVPEHSDNTLQMQEYVNAGTDYLRQHQNKYDTVVLDSWWTMLAGVFAQVDPHKTYHFVQSDPVFTPRTTSAIWEARLFAMLPLYPLTRIMVSKSTQELFKTRYNTEYPRIDLYVDDAYRQADFTVRDHTGPIKFISSASDFAIPSKGLDFLLDSLQQLDQPCELTLVSGTPIAKDISSYSFPVTTATARTPQEMIAQLQAHDVYVNTSTNETFGLALAEAITLGMPAIALDSGGNRDYTQGDNFIFVEDSTQFVDQLRQTMTLETRQQLHRNARASMSHYTLAQMVTQFKQHVGLQA